MVFGLKEDFLLHFIFEFEYRNRRTIKGGVDKLS